MTQFLSRHACICAFNYACGENWQAAGCVKARMHKRVPRGIGSGKPSQGAAAGACVCILSCWVRGEAGAVCVCVFSVFICSHAAPNYPTNPGRSESRHAGDSRDALIWHMLSRTHSLIRSPSEACAASCQLSHTATSNFICTLLHLFPFWSVSRNAS